MIPPRTFTAARAARARRAAADRPPAPNLDGVVGDVFVTVLLAAVAAVLVGAVLSVLWRALLGA